MDGSGTGLRVVLVDDDAMVRTGLSMILGGGSGIEVVGEAGDGAQAIEVVRAAQPDVVLMDIRMPVRDGLSALEEILGWPSPPRVIMLTTFDADDLVLRALRLGAHGFLLKDTPPRQIVEAVHDVASGAPALSPSVTAQLIATVTQSAGEPERDDRGERARAALATLTERELEVAGAVGRGLSNAEIAAELHLSIATVKAHIGRLFTKLGLDNRVQIALLVHDAQR
jgi:DNA-binding NarL/FixJ family response regulator